MINNCKDRTEFLQYFPTEAVGAEIGVFKGEFSKAILEISNPSSLHLIDVWWTKYGDHYPDWGDYTDFGKLTTKQAYADTLKNIESGKEKCQVYIGDDLEILEHFTGNFFDWVYIDSSHNYEHTKKELKLISNKMKPDGLITGHDWQPDPGHQHHGVFKAINEFTDATEWKVIYLDNHTQWALKRLTNS